MKEVDRGVKYSYSGRYSVDYKQYGFQIDARAFKTKNWKIAELSKTQHIDLSHAWRAKMRRHLRAGRPLSWIDGYGNHVSRHNGRSLSLAARKKPNIHTKQPRTRSSQLHTTTMMQQSSETALSLPLYGQDFKVDFIGKRRPKSKRQITWAFVQGTTPHTLMMTWSTKSGKVLIHLDGNEIDSSMGTLKGYSIVHRKMEVPSEKLHLEVLACRVAPNSGGGRMSEDDFLCYECIINGKAFSGLPKANDPEAHIMSVPVPADGELLMIKDGSNGSDEGEEDEEDNEEVMSYSGRDLSSVVDIVYPEGIPTRTY